MAVLGIGGLFFRARDPEALASWYLDHLNVGPGCTASDAEPDAMSWLAEGGPIVFAPFSQDTDYFGKDKAYMLNLRVRDLPEMISRLTSEGVEVTTRDEWDHPDIGRFARIHDPEGNPIELWEPPSPK
jgi:catechol 2,3-dioxygenase-like lactoylglutathione lyase family enzyme